MKKLTLLLTLLGFFAVGCADEAGEADAGADTEAALDEAQNDVEEAMDNVEAEVDSLGQAMEENIDAAQQEAQYAALDAADGAEGDGSHGNE
jgi:peptidoglycan hydrolase CwlO-like protein